MRNRRRARRVPHSTKVVTGVEKKDCPVAVEDGQMQMFGEYRMVRFASIVGMALLNSMPAAEGRDLYWQGQRDGIWHHGVDRNTGLSNWYTSDTGGVASRPPDSGERAFFPKPSQNVSIRITRDFEEAGRMLFEDEGRGTTARYSFRVSTIFTLTGGLFNWSKTPRPQFTIMDGAAIVLRSSAQFVAPGGATAAIVRIRQGGLLRLAEDSRARAAEVFNSGGTVDFIDSASADGVRITNGSTQSGRLSVVRFYAGSRTNGLNITNEDNASLNFTELGFVRAGAGRVENEGQVLLGRTQLHLSNELTLGSSGTLHIDNDSGQHGMLSSEGPAVRVGGKLVLSKFYELGPGTYTIIKSKFGIRGRFAEVDAFGGRIAYGANRVVFIKDPPP